MPYLCNCGGGITKKRFDDALREICGNQKPAGRGSVNKTRQAVLHRLGREGLQCHKCAPEMNARIKNYKPTPV